MGGSGGFDALLAEAAERHGIAVDAGLQLVTAAALPRRAIDPSWPLLVIPGDGAEDAGPADAAFRPAALPGRAAHAGSAAEIIRILYPAAHPVLGLAGVADTTAGQLDDRALGSGPHLLPALDPVDNVASPYGLPWLSARLRAPDGCPWDREQDHRSLRPFLLEEAYEVYDALEHGASPGLAEELGDLLLQIVLHAQLGAEEGLFDLTDVYRHISTKIVRRHPHVFAGAHAATAADVIQNWERIKADERAERARARAGTDPGEVRAAASGPPEGTVAAGSAAVSAKPPFPAAFAGLSRSLPALAYSQEMQGRAAALGYDWPDIEGVIEKLEEEAVELLEAGTDEERAEEFGDLLLVMVNLGRKLGVDAEAALRAGNAKFARRFAHVERLAAERNRRLDAMTFEELDELWNQAKLLEREAAPREERG